MRIFLFLMISLTLSFALRMTESVEEAERALVKAYFAGSKERAPYLYSKTKAYKEIAFILASNMDTVGTEIFSIRAVNTASLAINASLENKEELTPIEKVGELKAKRTFAVDFKEILRRLEFLRENKGLNCVPYELGRAEAFYEALVYAYPNERLSDSLIIQFYKETMKNLRQAEVKLKMAIENELECYTGRKIAIVLREEEQKEKKAEYVEEPLKIVARIHFDFDKYEIKEEYIPILNEVVKTLKENPFFKVRIEGYTDIIGPKEYNERLALKRAQAVKEYLVKHGIPEEKIEIVGYGKERFIADNETEIGRLTNRRVEFIIIKVQEE